ncbi:MAG: hypothetical protein H7Y03_02310 [Chitinophagaceae bacterium]|nr:hypothetical protein [Chitinophagaceae bacterium]
MKKLYLLLVLFVVTLTSCTKEVIVPVGDDVYTWMQTHDKGTVAYVDYYTGNYIVETFRGFSVVEPLDGIAPHENDLEYAYFGSRGAQSTYNYTGDYFTSINVVATRLSWSEAIYLIDQLSY